MFYVADILQKRRKFGVIWLASMKIRDLSKKDFMSVHLARTCDDIMAHIQRERKCVRLSLYTASHLMYGAVVIFQKQQHYLIDELTRLMLRIRRPAVDVFGASPERKWAVNSKRIQIELELPPIDLLTFNKSIQEISIAEIAVWEQPSSPQIHHSPGWLQAPRESITLPVPLREQPLVQEMDDFEITAQQEQVPSSISMPEPLTSLEESASDDARRILQTPAAVPVPQVQPTSPHKRPSLDRPGTSARRASRDLLLSASSSGLSLDEVVPGRARGRRRPRARIVDTDTRLSRQQMILHHQNTAPTVRLPPAPERMLRQLLLARQPAERLLTEPGLADMKSKRLMERWNNTVDLAGKAARRPLPVMRPRRMQDQSPAVRPPLAGTPIETPLPMSASQSMAEISGATIHKSGSLDHSSHSLSSPSLQESIQEVVTPSVSAPPFTEEPSFPLPTIHEAEELEDNIRGQAPGSQTTFFSICPWTTSRRAAAHKFSQLLAAAAGGRVEISQDVPYGDIAIRFVG